MRICQKHWNKLKDLIHENGLSSFIAKDAHEAMHNAINELKEEPTHPDPLMMCNNMLWSRAIETFGLEMMQGDKCPVCHANENYPKRDNELTGDFWVRTLVPHIKEMFQQRGLLNKN